MKNLNLKKVILLLLLAINFSSCHAQEVKFDFSSFDKGGLTNLKGPLVLINFKSTAEFHENSSRLFNLFYSDCADYFKKNKDVNNIITNFTTINNQLVISSIYFVNDVEKKIIEGYIYDQKSKSYVSTLNRGLEGSLFGSCPAGTSQIASCNNFASGGPGDCIASAIKSKLTKELSAAGDCVNIQVSVGAISTKVCAGGC